MKRAIIYCILFLIGLHLTARALEQIDVVAHFFLITLFGTTFTLPITSYIILKKESNRETVKSKIIIAITLLSVVYLSYLLDKDFNKHTDQIGRELGKLSLITGIGMVCILMVINLIQLHFKKNKNNEVQQGA